jgi:hypothetical protein
VRIVETEAYPVGDAAGHAFTGKPKFNKPLFEAFGRIHVYRSYGVFWLINIAAEQAGVGAGVLFRAGEPIWGVNGIITRRKRSRLVDLASGPGKLCEALQIDKQQDDGDYFRCLVPKFDGAISSREWEGSIMGQVLHSSATTTEAVRRAIQHSQASLRALAKRYGINPKTVAKWQKRGSVADLLTGPREPKSTVLSIARTRPSSWRSDSTRCCRWTIASTPSRRPSRI